MASNPSVNLADNRQPSLYAAVTVTWFFALVFVGLRFWSRHLKKVGFWLDDWFILAALTVSVGALADTYWWVPRGYGRHREAFGPDANFYFFVGFFVFDYIYTSVIVLAKYSIMSLYWRIFGHTGITVYIWILAAVTTGWGLSCYFTTTFICVPTQGLWDKSIPASCNVDMRSSLISFAVINTTTDLALLTLPIRYVINMNASTSEKRLVMGTFLMGGFVSIASVMHLVTVITQSESMDDLPWTYVDHGIWSAIEIHFSIISACLPILRPAWIRLFGRKRSRQRQPQQCAARHEADPGKPRTFGSSPVKELGKGRDTWFDESVMMETVTECTSLTVDFEDEDDVLPTKYYETSRERRPSVMQRRMSELGQALAKIVTK